jgi:hypothetical protein
VIWLGYFPGEDTPVATSVQTGLRASAGRSVGPTIDCLNGPQTNPTVQGACAMTPSASPSSRPSPTTTTSHRSTPTKTSASHNSSGTAASPPVTSGQACTAPAWRSSSPDAMWTSGDYIVHNNMWNAGSYSVSQSLAACSYHSWNVTVTANNASGDGAVKTYPNVHRDYHNWDTGKEPAWSSFSQVRSTFATAEPRVGIYDVAYDIWMNGVPGNREIMIWTDNYHQVPSGSKVGSVSISGITWDAWATGSNEYLAFVPRTTLSKGSLDLKAMIDWFVARGRIPAGSTLGQICFGVEIVSTVGKPATFQFTNFSITSS